MELIAILREFHISKSHVEEPGIEIWRDEDDIIQCKIRVAQALSFPLRELFHLPFKVHIESDKSDILIGNEQDPTCIVVIGTTRRSKISWWVICRR